jgi:hypothetical protein
MNCNRHCNKDAQVTCYQDANPRMRTALSACNTARPPQKPLNLPAKDESCRKQTSHQRAEALSSVRSAAVSSRRAYCSCPVRPHPRAWPACACASGMTTSGANMGADATRAHVSAATLRTSAQEKHAFLSRTRPARALATSQCN